MTKKMLIVSRGNEIGGGTEYVITIVKMLHEKFDVDIHMTYGKEEVKNHYLKYFDYVTFHHVPMVREINLIADIKSTLKLVQLIKEEKFDIVHTNTSKGGIIGRIAAKLAKVPFVFHTVHGFAFHEQSSKLSIAIYSLFERIAAKCCNYIITVSDFHRDWAVKLKIAPEYKIISIPNGLDPLRVQPTVSREQIREKLGIKSNEIAIFTIGRLAKQKGIEYLLEAIQLLKDEQVNKEYHFYIVGSGELKEDLKNRAKRLSIEDKVTFLGFREDVNNLLNAADIVVLPSLREGLSIALLEAMAAKKAIICTNIGSNRTVVQDEKEALVVEPKDSIALKDKIKILIENESLREKIAEAAYVKFNLAFTKDVMLRKYFDFYVSKAELNVKDVINEQIFIKSQLNCM